MTDALLAAIVAAPEDDAPRLVWADREGGERGELVVLQCGETTPERALRAAQLVTTHGDRWTRLSSIARPKYVRGFVEGLTIPMAKLEAHVVSIWKEEPLVRSLVVTDIAAYATHSSDGNNAWAIAAFTLAAIFARAPHRTLTSLTLSPFAEATGLWEDLYFRRDTFGANLTRVVAESPPLASVRELTIPGFPDATAQLRARR